MARGKQFRWKFIIDADSESGQKSLRKVREEVQQLDSAEKKSIGTRDRLKKSTDSLFDSIKRLAGPVSLGLLAYQFHNVTKETALLEGQLVTMTGSQEKAAMAFDRLNSFAADTPFTLQQSVQGFIKLTALGLTPSERALRSYGNTASAMGKDMEQMIEAVADASTMEFERLKEFGIKARQEADTVSFTFQGVTTTVQKEAAAIEEYLMGIGEVSFGDAMANQMERIPGMLSNLEDAWDNMFRAMGEGGATNVYANLLEGATHLVQGITSLIENLERILASTFAAIDRHAAGFVTTMELNFHTIRTTAGTAAAEIQAAFEVAGTYLESIWSGVIDTLIGLYADWVDVVSKGVDFIPGAGGFAEDMRQSAEALRAQIDASGDLDSRLEEIERNQAAREQERLRRNEITKKSILDAYQARLDAADAAVAIAFRESEASALLDQALEDLAKTRGQDEDATSSQAKEAQDLVKEMEHELALLQMSAFDREFATRTRELSAEAVEAEGEQIRNLLRLIQDETEAQKERAAAIKEAEKIRQNQIENTQKAIEGLLDDYFEKKKTDVGDFFDFILKNWLNTVKKMMAADITSAIFGGSAGGGPMSLLSGGGGGGGGFNPLNLAGLSGSGSLLSGAGGFAQGMFGYGQGAAGFMGPMTQSATMGANVGAFMTSPAGIAIAAAMVGKLIHDKTSNPDGFTNSMAGMLVAPTPGANRDGLFDVDAFASGFDPTGFADRKSREEAEQVINTFRSLDETIVELVRNMGGLIDLSDATLAGVGVEGRIGTAGTFLGQGGRTENFGAQVDLFARQLARHVGGLSQDVMDELAAARTAEQIVTILTQAQDSADALGNTTDGLRQAEELLARIREASNRQILESMSQLGVAMDELAALQRNIENDLFAAQGIATLYRDAAPVGVEGTFADQIAGIEAQRQALLAQHAEQLAFERELHQERVRSYREQIAIASNLSDTVFGILGGSNSPLSNQQQFEMFGSEFDRLAGLAEGGDTQAAGKLRSVADTYVQAIRDRFASSMEGDVLVNQVVNRLTGIQGQFAGVEDPGSFSANGANQALIAGLESLQQQVTQVHDAIATDAVNQLIQLNSNVLQLPDQIATAQNLPDVLGAVVSQLVAAGLPYTVAADQIAQSPVLTNAANQYLQNNGGGTVADYTSAVNPAASPDLIQDFADQVIARHGGVNDASAREFIETAIANGVGSKQVADALGLDQTDVINLSKSLGLQEFAGGGTASGPESGYPVILHGTEHVTPDNTMKSVVTELHRLSEKLEQLTEVTMAVADHASQQRIDGNQKLEKLGEKMSGPGVGSARYAKSA